LVLKKEGANEEQQREGARGGASSSNVQNNCEACYEEDHTKEEENLMSWSVFCYSLFI
jgi:hypothetical protein